MARGQAAVARGQAAVARGQAAVARVPPATLAAVSVAVRNVLIVFALAALVFVLPGGDDGAYFIRSLLSLAITAVFAMIGARMYRENRIDIYSLGDRWRAGLYLAIAGIVFAIAGTSRLFDSGSGILLWFAVVGASVYTLVMVYRQWKTVSY